jgi:hypothetical protein
MADEGGASAALMEIDDDRERHHLHKALQHRERRQRRIAIALGIASASLILGVGAWLFGSTRILRRRGLRWSDIVGVRARLDWG